MWSAGLKALHLDQFNRPLLPHALPAPLLYLSLGLHSGQPLHADVLPSSLVELHLGYDSNRPLPPGVLPSSLRRLNLGCNFDRRLKLGSLPEGLLFVRFYRDSDGFDLPLPPLQSGVLPSTLLGVDFGTRYHHPLPAGIIPSSVQQIRLSNRHRDKHIELVLPPHAECAWTKCGRKRGWYAVSVTHPFRLIPSYTLQLRSRRTVPLTHATEASSTSIAVKLDQWLERSLTCQLPGW